MDIGALQGGPLPGLRLLGNEAALLLDAETALSRASGLSPASGASPSPRLFPLLGWSTPGGCPRINLSLWLPDERRVPGGWTWKDVRYRASLRDDQDGPLPPTSSVDVVRIRAPFGSDRHQRTATMSRSTSTMTISEIVSSSTVPSVMNTTVPAKTTPPSTTFVVTPVGTRATNVTSSTVAGIRPQRTISRSVVVVMQRPSIAFLEITLPELRGVQTSAAVAGATTIIVNSVLNPSSGASNKAMAIGRLQALLTRCPLPGQDEDVDDVAFVWARDAERQPSPTAALWSTCLLVILSSAAVSIWYRTKPLQLAFVAVVMYYVPNTVNLASRVVSLHASAASSSVAGAAGCFVVAMALLVALVHLIGRRWQPDHVIAALATDESQSKKDHPSAPQDAAARGSRAPGAERALVTPAQRGCVAVHYFVDGARDPATSAWRRLHSVIDLGVAVALAAVTGIQYGNLRSCGFAAVSVLILCVIHLGYVLLVRPFDSRKDLAVTVVNIVGVAAVAGCSAAALLVESHNGLPSERLTLAVVYVSGILTAVFYVELILECAIAVHRRCRRRASRRVGFDDEGDAGVPLRTVVAGGNADGTVGNPLLAGSDVLRTRPTVTVSGTVDNNSADRHSVRRRHNPLASQSPPEL